MKIFISLFLFIGVLGLFSGPAGAGQPLAFGSKIGESSRYALEGYLQASLGQSPENMLIAPVDLNNDGLSEFVIKNKNCDAGDGPCHFLFVSETGESITLLADITARTVAVDNETVQGVRNLLAYRNGINDYEYTVYVWEPQASRYMMAEDR